MTNLTTETEYLNRFTGTCTGREIYYRFSNWTFNSHSFSFVSVASCPFGLEADPLTVEKVGGVRFGPLKDYLGNPSEAYDENVKWEKK